MSTETAESTATGLGLALRLRAAFPGRRTVLWSDGEVWRFRVAGAGWQIDRALTNTQLQRARFDIAELVMVEMSTLVAANDPAWECPSTSATPQ